jgi:hypothetical protein
MSCTQKPAGKSEDTAVYGRTIGKQGGKTWPRLTCLRTGTHDEPHEHSNEPSGQQTKIKDDHKKYEICSILQKLSTSCMTDS